uniref:Serine hydrolase domain-containing protein n=1 Tax=Mycena chlorophos TaxID=658473 RepID=A0ABQ0LFZ7_MYCCL|nr:predicted protein [Mycena chlorophos]
MQHRPLTLEHNMLNILVIHGYVQSANTVAHNTRPLLDALSDIAQLHYVDGPALPPTSRFGSSSRPWWFLGPRLEFDHAHGGDARWTEVVEWWSEELSKRQYDGVIGLSQGSAMAGLLLSMVNHPERVPNFKSALKQNFKFGIFCSGFVSHNAPHGELYGIPEIPTLHTVDDNDMIVPASRTVELQGLCKNSVIHRHHEGHAVPVGGNFPVLMRDFVLEATKE